MNRSPNCSLIRFKKLSQGEEFYTIFSRKVVNVKEMDCLSQNHQKYKILLHSNNDKLAFPIKFAGVYNVLYIMTVYIVYNQNREHIMFRYRKT